MKVENGRPKIKSLSQMYVFYESLKNDNYVYANGETSEGLYRAAEKGVEDYGSYYKGEGKSAIASTLISMANAEKDKEIAALNDIFGVSGLSIDLANPEDIKALVIALNSTLNLKSSFERNLTRIKKAGGKINVASLFDKYFYTAWKAAVPSILDQIIDKCESLPTTGIADATDEVLDQKMPIIVKDALKRMFASGILDGDTESGLEQVLQEVDNYAGTNNLVAQLTQAYHLDKLREDIKETLKLKGKLESKKDIILKTTEKKITKGNYQKGGLTLEYIENYFTSMLMSGTISNGSIEIKMKGGAIHTGGTEIKADNIYTFGFDTSVVDETLESMEGTRVERERNIKAIEGLTEKLKGLHDGYIIYSSAKNYSLSEHFKGFSQGSPISVSTLEEITKNTTKMGAILQTAKGAVGRKYINDVKMSIAEDIAYYLFDDISTVGTNTSSVKALHLFDLDGIFIPLSVLLYKIGAAINEVQKVPASLITVKIIAPPIMYGNKNVYSMEMWNTQRDEAKANTKISAHFFRDFFNFMKQF